MRVKIYLEVPREVSIFYRRSILSFIKKVLESEDKEYSDKVFSRKSFKPFTFCVFFSGISVNGNSIRNDGKAILTVSSGSPDFFIRFNKGLKNFKEYRAKHINGSMKIVKTEVVDEDNINSSKQVFRTLSPIIVVNKERHPVLPSGLKMNGDSFIVYDDEAFTQELRYSLKCIFNGLPELKFVHKDGKKAVVKHLVGPSDKEKVIKIVAYQGIFTLEADPYVLNEIYRYGLGFRRYQGFGCLEVVKEN